MTTEKYDIPGSWHVLMLCFLLLLGSISGAAGIESDILAEINRKPNVIFILSDDIGYGDLGCYGAQKVSTPNLDRLAAMGLQFTNAYSPASTCTPSRYTLLTGKYAWRFKLGVINGDAPMCIQPGTFTLPSLFKSAGYATACVGKWHLGLGTGTPDYNRQIRPGLQDLGFDYSFIIPATNDRVPCVFLENDSVVGLVAGDPIKINYSKKIGDWPTGRENPELLKLEYLYGHDHTIINGISRIGYMTGGKNALWVDESITDTLTSRAVSFIEKNHEDPFFLYFTPHAIHEPRTPGERFKGSSKAGIYGDFVQELDWSVGEIMKVIEDYGLSSNTWIIFTSDNGPEIAEGYRDGALENLNGHDPKAGLRGGKYTLFEAGTRMPFISCWPGMIDPGICNAIFSYTDILASFLTFFNLPKPIESIDSRNALKVILGKKKHTDHNEILIQDNPGHVAIRKGNWKYIPAGTHQGGDQEYLFNLEKDMYETKNLLYSRSKKAEQLKSYINLYRKN